MPDSLTFLRGNPLSTTLTRQDGTPIYTSETPLRLFGNRITRIKRAGPEGGTLIAKVEWVFPYDEETIVTFYGGSEAKIGVFLVPARKRASAM